MTIPGHPQGKGRPRLGRNGRAFTPKSTKQWESRARVLLRCGWQGPPVPKGIPVRVEIHQVEPRPQRFRGPDARHLCPSGGRHADADNVAKICLDALRDCWHDDAQVADLRCLKMWCAHGEPACTEVRVTVLKPGDQLSLWSMP